MGFNSLSQDTYNLMMLSDGFFHRDWQLGFIVFLFQLGLGILTLYSQLVSSESDYNDTILQIPIHTETQVKILQISSIFISIYYQGDVFDGIALPIDLRLHGPHPWGGIPITEDEKDSKGAWMYRVLLPNFFKFIQGFVVLLASLIVIVQSTDVIELLKDFTSLYVISSIDDITFSVARRGFFGTTLKVKAARTEEIEISSIAISSQETQNGHRRWSNGTIIKTLVLHTILALSVATWIVVSILQGKGIMAELKYPKCESAVPSFKSEWTLLENDVCNVVFNHPDCAYDGGDCSEFNLIYPGCEVEDVSLLGNEICNGSPYDSDLCRFDGGDCPIEEVIKAKYPECGKAEPSFSTNWTMVENGVCDLIFAIPECGMDGGDCLNVNLFYPNCEVKDIGKVGDGKCDNYGGYNIEECGFDGGDCTEFNSNYPDCKIHHASKIGDGICQNRGAFNTEACGWDGGDCIDFNTNYPNCIIDDASKVGDGLCNGGAYNSEACGFDGGDCIEFNSNYPNCTVDDPFRIGNGQCDSLPYNSEVCGWDGGDCP